MGSNRDEFAFWSISSVDKNLGKVGFDVTLLGLRVTHEEVAELKGLYNFSSGKYIYPRTLVIFFLVVDAHKDSN